MPTAAASAVALNFRHPRCHNVPAPGRCDPQHCRFIFDEFWLSWCVQAGSVQYLVPAQLTNDSLPDARGPVQAPAEKMHATESHTKPLILAFCRPATGRMCLVMEPCNVLGRELQLCRSARAPTGVSWLRELMPSTMQSSHRPSTQSLISVSRYCGAVLWYTTRTYLQR